MEEYSVLMSVYQKEKPEYLRESLESVFAQTVPTNDFVLVCDGALTKDLERVLQNFSSRYAEVLHIVRLEKNVGLGPALNAGLQYCCNDLVARMDSDDYALAGRCALQLKMFQARPELAIVGGAIEEFEGSPENVVSFKRMPVDHEQILTYSRRRCPFNHPTVMYRKSMVQKVGGYPNLPMHEDYGLWVRLLMNNAQAYNLPDVLCKMRVDGGLYSRRGGIKYFRTALGFRWHLFRIGYCNFFEFLYGLLGLAVLCLIPTSMRKKMYKKFLRTSV